MSDREALSIFTRQPVNQDMVNFLVATTNSIIQVKPQIKPSEKYLINNQYVSPIVPTISLTDFIKNLIRYSNVQTPTLMATLVYLNKLRNLLPANAVGMETTRHRIFLSALIIAAKSLNDSSPLNKHWTKYTDGLLSLQEVNLAEKELLALLNWSVNIKEQELIIALQPFLVSIKNQLIRKQELESIQKSNYYRISQSKSNYSIKSSRSVQSSYSVASNLSLSHSISTMSIDDGVSTHESSAATASGHEIRKPLANRSINTLNDPISKKSLPSSRNLSRLLV
ncbi:PCL2 [[Candida] subhashii]|uniref:PCL2 n=1 Tax=[Candida] subhashii TaxID=561895 RepID=A0A8J5QKF5_9ASCO|nr:PCL2 [[Candida] subhashii]KAG7663624.1 PCL2 [[Candida] subhashii]